MRIIEEEENSVIKVAISNYEESNSLNNYWGFILKLRDYNDKINSFLTHWPTKLSSSSYSSSSSLVYSYILKSSSCKSFSSY